MIHSHPVTVDIIVGEMNISSSQMLIGMPAMAAKIIMCMVRRHPRSKPPSAPRCWQETERRVRGEANPQRGSAAFPA